MPKRSKQENGQILHAFYPYAHLKIRNGIYYTVIHDKPVTTKIRSDAKVLKDRIAAKQQAVAILNIRVKEYLGINTQEDVQPLQVVAPRPIVEAPVPVRFNPTNNAPLLLDLSEEYLSIKRRVVSADVMKHLLSNLKLFLTHDYPISEYTAIRAMIVKNANRHNHAPSTAQKHHRLLSAFFEWCKKAGYADINPMDAIQSQRVPQKDVVFPTWAEFNTVVEHYQKKTAAQKNYRAEHEYNVRFWKVLAMTGMRIGEAIVLKVSDFTEDGFIIDGKRKYHNEERKRWFLYAAVPGTKDLLQECIKHAQRNGNLWPWSSYQNPAFHWRNTVRELGMNEEYSPHSLRRLAKWWWEVELGLPAHVCNLLAGHSFAVRNKYHRTPTIEDLEGYLKKT